MKQIRQWCLSVCLLVFENKIACLASAFAIEQGVKTSSGVIVGHSAAHITSVSEYLGIPFAKPPLGNLRFAPPQPFTSTALFHADSFSPSCPQLDAGLNLPNLTSPSAQRMIRAITSSGQPDDEDCLTLNIWTQPQLGEKSKAVLLWIYGGGLSQGSTASPLYNGEYLAAYGDVVVVSINYRLNIFGFPGLPGRPQNVGLEDQRFAIEWVQKNIAAFGGDPKRITIFGESAGAESVDFYSYAYASDPIVNGFIEQSGTVGIAGFRITTSSGQNPLNNTAQWYNVSSALGCGGPGTEIDATISCIQTKDWNSLLEASAPYAFVQTIDEKLVFSDYPTRAKLGRFAKKPHLIGNNDYESGIFAIAFPLTREQWEVANLIGFTCPARDAAKARVDAHVPIWRYRWFGEFPNTILTYNPPSGAYHGSEEPIIFGTAADVSGTPNTLAEDAIILYMIGAWSTFAKNPATGLSSFPFNWPSYNPSTSSLVRLGLNNKTASFVNPSVYDDACASIGNTF